MGYGVIMNKKGVVYIIIAAILWGVAGVFVRSLTAIGITAMQTVFLRVTFASCMLGATILATDRTAFKVRFKDIWLFALNGILSIVMFNFCYYKTMELSTLSVAAVLLYTAPFFVLFISAFVFKERITVQKLLACAVAFIGCCFVSGALGNAQTISTACLIYGLLTGFGYSLYTIFGNLILHRGYKSLTVTFYTFVFATLGSAPLLFSQGIDTALSHVSGKALLIAAGMALVNTVLPYIFYTQGLKTVESSKAPIIATIEPVTATFVGLFYKEPLTVHGIIGIVLVLGSVIVLNLTPKKEKRKADEAKG